MTIVEDKMIELGLRYIKYTGNHPLQPGYTRKLLWSLWVPGAIYGFVLTFIGFCKLDGDIEVLASKAEGFLAQFQVKSEKGACQCSICNQIYNKILVLNQIQHVVIRQKYFADTTGKAQEVLENH